MRASLFIFTNTPWSTHLPLSPPPAPPSLPPPAASGRHLLEARSTVSPGKKEGGTPSQRLVKACRKLQALFNVNEGFS